MHKLGREVVREPARAQITIESVSQRDTADRDIECHIRWTISHLKGPEKRRRLPFLDSTATMNYFLFSMFILAR